MAIEPEVQAVEVGMILPVMPKNKEMFTAAVCGIIFTYEFAVRSPVVFSVNMKKKSFTAKVLPNDEP